MNELLHQHIREYDPCKLCEIGSNRKAFFLIHGAENSKVLFIGDGPGPGEQMIQLPIVGLPWMILHDLCEEAGLRSYAVTNLIVCFPSSPEKITEYRKPSKLEITNCAPRLDDYIECNNFKYYISIGSIAKKNPPNGISYDLDLDAPSLISISGGKNTLVYKRCKHKLKNFIESEGLV